MGTNIDNRKVEKIDITVTIDQPDPFPMMLHEEVGTGKQGDVEISVNRNIHGNLLLITTTRGDKTTGYVVDVSNIVKGILAHEEKTNAN